MATLDLVPKQLDLKLYIGDDPRIQFTVWEDDTKTTAVDLTDYTNWAATIRSKDGTQTASFTVDSASAADGIVILELEGEDIRGFPHTGCRWDASVDDPDGRDITLMRGRVSLVEDVST